MVGVHAAEFGEREGRDFDVIAGFFGGTAHDESLAFQSDSEADKCGDIRQAVSCCFGEKRDSSGGARVDFDDVDILPLIDDELDIEETADPDAETEPFRVVEDSLFDTRREAVGWVYADRVARVHAGAFDQLHDTGDKNPLAVAYRIDFYFFAADVVVHEDRTVFVNGLGGL